MYIMQKRNENIKKIDIAYIAGLFDGEGNARVEKYKSSKNGKYYYRIRARIFNTNITCLYHVKKIIGYGGVYASHNPRGKKPYKTCYVYNVQNKKAKKFIKLIKSFTIIKMEQIDNVLKIRHTGAV